MVVEGVVVHWVEAVSRLLRDEVVDVRVLSGCDGNESSLSVALVGGGVFPTVSFRVIREFRSSLLLFVFLGRGLGIAGGRLLSYWLHYCAEGY